MRCVAVEMGIHSFVCPTSDKSVTHTKLSDQHFGRALVLLELAAQAFDVNPKVVSFRCCVRSPDFGRKLAVG
jgi:hypothetical protein